MDKKSKFGQENIWTSITNRNKGINYLVLENPWLSCLWWLINFINKSLCMKAKIIFNTYFFLKVAKRGKKKQIKKSEKKEEQEKEKVKK